MIESISLQRWHQLAQQGAYLPMRIQVNGTSMYPLLRRNRDYVTIHPLSEIPRQGDIVLFSDPDREARYVLHRVWRVEKDAVLTWGDNCRRADGLIPLSCIWGKAVLIERGKLRITPEPSRGLRLARCWHILGRGYRTAERLGRKLTGAVKRRLSRTNHE